MSFKLKVAIYSSISVLQHQRLSSNAMLMVKVKEYTYIERGSLSYIKPARLITFQLSAGN